MFLLHSTYLINIQMGQQIQMQIYIRCDDYSREETIQRRKLLINRSFWLRKLFKGGKYSREETICGNKRFSFLWKSRVIGKRQSCFCVLTTYMSHTLYNDGGIYKGLWSQLKLRFIDCNQGQLQIWIESSLDSGVRLLKKKQFFS